MSHAAGLISICPSEGAQSKANTTGKGSNDDWVNLPISLQLISITHAHRGLTNDLPKAILTQTSVCNSALDCHTVALMENWDNRPYL